MRYLGFIPIICFLLLTNLISGISESVSPDGLTARIEYQDDQRILVQWGYNYDMGYAEGYLLADEIINLIDLVMIDKFVDGYIPIYNDLLDEVENNFYFPPEYEEQLNGIIQGMRDSNADLYLSTLDREIEILDLKLWNAFLDFSGGCLSFVIWGDASLTGESIHARKFVYQTDAEGYFDSYAFLRVVDHTYDSAASWMSVGWPGFIGVLSGINEHGTVISVNFGADGERNLENTQNLPVGLLLRLSLETANPNEPVESTEEIIANHEKRTGVVIHLTYPN